jgi:hypothetical protein
MGLPSKMVRVGRLGWVFSSRFLGGLLLEALVDPKAIVILLEGCPKMDLSHFYFLAE